jgi:hypothetical protein
VCNTAAPASRQRAASSTIAAAVLGYFTSGLSQQMFGVAVIIKGFVVIYLSPEKFLIYYAECLKASAIISE